MKISMINKSLPYLMLILIVYSCKKDNLSDLTHRNTAICGKVDSTFSHFDLQPSFSIHLVKVDDLDYKGYDSLDFDQDEFYDFRIYLWTISAPIYCNMNPLDTTIIVDYFPLQNPMAILTTDYEMISKEYSKQGDTIYIPDVMEAGDTVSEKSIWHDYHTYSLWQFNGPNYERKWFDAVSDKFIGFRKKVKDTYKYGWIRLTVNPNFMIKDVLMEK
jgi:hypothetical protein